MQTIYQYCDCYCFDSVLEFCANLFVCESVSLILAHFPVPRVYLEVLETAYRGGYD